MNAENARDIGIKFEYGFALLVIKYHDSQIEKLIPIKELNNRFRGIFNLAAIGRPPVAVDCYAVDDHVSQAWDKISKKSIDDAFEDNAVRNDQELLENLKSIREKVG